MLKDYSEMDYNPTAEKIVDVLCRKTQNSDPLFARILTAYYLAKVASMMRCNINTHDRGIIPINLYAINLAASGHGKGHSTNIIEEQVINQFRERFLEEAFPYLAELNLVKLANKRAAKKATDPDDELVRVTAEFEQAGNMLFSFDSGTTAAVKQMRHKLLMANAGSMNMEIDEIGSNLLGNMDVLNTFLELYDVGKVKQKLTKNTADNIRGEEIDGRTPTNMMLYGTPSKLLNGGRVEEEIISFFETGYSRRCFFGYTKGGKKASALTPEEMYKRLTDSSSEQDIQDISDALGQLADPVNFGKSLNMSKDVTILSLYYKAQCESIADQLGEHEDIRKAEIAHRYFKALKLAGAYAYIEGSSDVTENHLYNAIKLAEDSGKAFSQILTRDKNYVKLAKFISEVNTDVTHADLVESLPFYKGSAAQKAELMNLAIAYGHKNNIVIKKMYSNNIEFLRGESLAVTDPTKMTISYSSDITTGYNNEYVSFDQLHKLTQQPNYHWVSHHLIDGYRKEDNALAGFNLVVIDVDGGVAMKTAELLLKDYKFHMYTTKRHQKEGNGDRFRIILPMSHTLKMDASEFKEFMNNIFEWLPFDCDKETNQRARKWLTHKGSYINNDGELLDSLLFIPKTSKNEERKVILNDQQSFTNMERWFLNNTGQGNRSNQLVKYALLLVDSGLSFEDVSLRVNALNEKLADKMSEVEIMSTILATASKRIHSRDTANS